MMSSKRLLCVVTALVVISFFNTFASQEILSKGCDKEGVVCHGLPSGCLKSTGSPCEVLAKIATVNDLINIQLNANANQTKLHLNLTDRWIAVGFSKSGKMPDAAVLHCFRDQNSTATAKLTVNIPTGHLNLGWATIDQTPLEVVSTTGDDDHFGCVVNIHRNFTILASHFDLSLPHKLLVATGPLMEAAIKQHDRKPAISDMSHAF